MIPQFFAKMFGKYAANKLNLKDDNPMNESKPWYQSKTIWSDVATIVVAIVGFVDVHFAHGSITSSPAYSVAMTVLGAMGIVTRTTATAKIG